MKDKLLCMMGMSRKAGKLVMGFDAVAKASAKAMMKKQLILILVAQDVSEKSKSEIIFVTQKNYQKITYIPVTMDEIFYRIGKRTGIFAVTDTGFIKAIQLTICNVNEED